MYENSQDGFGEAPAPPLTIAAGGLEVLPRIDRPALCDMLRRLPEEDLQLALRHKLVPVVALPGLVLHVACGAQALAEGRARGFRIVGRAERHDLVAAARAIHGRALLSEATLGLARRSPQYSARRRLAPGQGLALILSAGLLAEAGLLLPLTAVWFLASILAGVFFLSVVALRLLCFLPPVPRQSAPARPAALAEEALPSYSVLVPLFRETAVLGQLLGAMGGLNYPPGKLDIKLILEEDDIPMQQAVARMPLPEHVEVIVVPAGKPQTKPRALNYALQFCRGELLTIYDAEDIPAPDQLLKAAARFAVAPPELACLQAELTFFNPEDNWLARQFTAEYALLFGILLPVLADHRLPLPLGGTSNHFRTAALRQVGGWDPFNVTEDADLGLRLVRHGYDTGTLDSRTLEEANTRLRNWLRQRARWLKGFLATWLVHMREPGRLLRELGPAGFLAAQAVTIGVFASALLHPLLLAFTVWVVATRPLLGPHAGLGAIAVAGLNMAVFAAGYGTAFLLTRRALLRQGIRAWGLTVASLPAYWVLMSAAAWLALWQFITAPFHWNKTEHGFAAYQPQEKPRRRSLFRRRGSARARPRGSQRK